MVRPGVQQLIDHINYRLFARCIKGDCSTESFLDFIGRSLKLSKTFGQFRVESIHITGRLMCRNIQCKKGIETRSTCRRSLDQFRSQGQFRLLLFLLQNSVICQRLELVFRHGHNHHDGNDPTHHNRNHSNYLCR